jgi:DNA-binding transcriptional MerR regulator
MNRPTAAHEKGVEALMRSGVAARLAGLSASTLRIWEYRYGVVAPPKSAAGQRTYSMKDIERLRLIKQLTAKGHAISTLAHLDLDALLHLSSERQMAASGPPKVVVVGQAAARKLEGRLKPGASLVFDDLDHAERDIPHADAAGALVVYVRTLHAPLAERILGLRHSLSGLHTVVVYSFGAEVVPESLRAAGVTVRREPMTGKELADLITTAPPTGNALVTPSIRSGVRRYSDAALVSLTEIPSLVACECPRHLAEIVTLLVGFEQYSTECASQNRKDAALHRHLCEVTSAARAMLEQALERVVIEEGLVVNTRS